MQIRKKLKDPFQAQDALRESSRKHPRVLVVDTLDYQEFHVGGTLTFIKKYFKYSQFDFYLVGLTDDHVTEVGKWKSIAISKKKFHFLPVAYIKSPQKSYRLSLVFNCLRYRKKILQFNYDAIFIQSAEFGFPFLLSRKPIFLRMAGANNPLVASKFELFRSSFFQSIFTTLFFLPVVRKAKKIFAINEECEHLLKSYNVSGQKIRRIYLGVDLASFELDKYECRQKLGFDYGDKILIYSGRLSKAKGIDLLIDALSLIQDKTVKLIIVGDGEEKKNIHKRVLREKLTNVLLVGFVKGEEIPGYLRAADVFCMASYYEGLSNSMIEALAAGLPIVTTRVAGSADIVIDGKNGKILNDRNPRSYSQAIKEVLGFNMENVQEVNTKLCNMRFNIKNIVKQIDREIMESLGGADNLTQRERLDGSYTPTSEVD